MFDKLIASQRKVSSNLKHVLFKNFMFIHIFTIYSAICSIEKEKEKKKKINTQYIVQHIV